MALRVLLVSANTDFYPDPVFPLGAACVAAAARQAGHELRCLDLCFSASPLDDLEAAIRGFDPQVVAFSLRNLDSVSFPDCSSYVEDYLALLRRCRALTQAPVVLGGAGFTVMPQTVLDYLGADYGIAGEGEAAFPWLLGEIEAGREPGNSADYKVVRVGKGICVYSLKPIFDLGALPRPARDLFDAARYYERGGVLNIQSKRGCQFECLFCSYPLIEGSRIRSRSASSLVDEMEEGLRDYGARHWFIADSVFNAPIQHAKEVCREILARGLRLDWTAYFNPMFFDEELAGLLRRSGCRSIDFGTDSGSPLMIHNLKKTFGLEHLRKASALCHTHGIRVCHSLIFGGPGESLESIEETIALMEECKPAAVIAMTGIRIHPGTGMADLAVKQGVIAPDDNLLFPRFYIEPSLGEAMVRRVEAYASTHPSWIVPGRGVKANIEALQKVRDKRIKGRLWPVAG